MGSRGSFRLPARLALSAVLAALAAPALAGAVRADDHRLSVVAHLGYADVIKAGQWMPVNIDVTNKGADFQGAVQIAIDAGGSFNGGPVPFMKGPYGLAQNATYQLSLSLPAGATKHLRTYVSDDVPGVPIGVRLLENGHLISTQTIPSPTTASVLVGVLSDAPAAFDEFGALPLPANFKPQVSHLKRQDLPDSGILLRGFDLIAIDDFATDGLTVAQRSAITDYVANGGSLLIGSGASWHKTFAGLDPVLLPLAVTGTTVIPSSRALAGVSAVEVATGNASAAHTWLAEGAQPLMLEKTVGSGTVTLATFDWAQDPIASWSGSKDLLRQVAVRGLFGASTDNVPMGIGGGGPVVLGSGAGGSITQRSSSMMSPLGNLPALDLPSLRLTGLLILLYVLIVGPGNYLVLRVLGRRELSWVTIPAIATIFALGAYGIGIGTKGHSVQSNQVSIVHLVTGSTRAYRESYTGIFAPTRGDYSVTIPGSTVQIAPIASGYDASGRPAGVQILPDSNEVDLLGVTAFNLRGFATESLVKAPALTAHIDFTKGKLVGRVENHSTIMFSDAVLIAGDAYQALGAISPGATMALDLQPLTPNAFGGNPVFTRIYSGTATNGSIYYNGGPAGRLSDAERRAQDRSQILQLLLGASYGPTAPAISPMLVAWTNEPLQPISVNGSVPRSHATNAIVIPLPVTQLSSGTLPAGLVTGRLVDLSGEGQPGPGSIFLTSGKATFEFSAPLAAGVHLTGAGLSSSNPYGGKFGAITPGSGQPQSTLQVEAWDWATSAWMPLDFKDNATTPLPDRAVDATTGMVRLRANVSQANGPGPGFYLGGLSLTGTLQ